MHVRPQRTAVDWANEIQHLLEIEYPEAERIRLVCDNLNTHKLGSLYEAFAPATARGLAQRLEIHYTPKHGSWLNIAELELSVLTRQCLDRRIPDLDTVTQAPNDDQPSKFAGRCPVLRNRSLVAVARRGPLSALRRGRDHEAEA